MKAAKRKYGLVHLATEEVEDFDTSTHETYTEEEPNSLEPDEVPVFLIGMREMYPQHFAMTFLGFATGLRPSSLRPLRRRGPTPDIRWEEGKLLVRRSHSLGNETMATTKQKVRYAINLPTQALDVLKWHVDTQLRIPAQADSDLLFPSVEGGFRSPSVLNKPFADVAEAIGLGKKFSQRGLRRTFNDLARAAEVESIVTRSISGHLTERMQDHYSTVHPDEQRQSIAKVIDLATRRPGTKTAPTQSNAPVHTAPAERSDVGKGESRVEPSGAPGGAPSESASGAPMDGAPLESTAFVRDTGRPADGAPTGAAPTGAAPTGAAPTGAAPAGCRPASGAPIGGAPLESTTGTALPNAAQAGTKAVDSRYKTVGSTVVVVRRRRAAPASTPASPATEDKKVGTNTASGAPGGAPPPASGAPKQKAG